MDPITIVALIIFIPIIVLAIRGYVEYRQILNKRENAARIARQDYRKPTIIDDTKTGLSIFVVIIVGVLILLIAYAVLHWFAPGMFPSINVD